MVSEALGIGLSDFEIENVMWKCDSLWQVVKIVIGGVPHVIEVCFMCLSLSVGRILLQSLVLTNQMEPMRNQVVFRKAEVSILLFGIIYLMAQQLPPEVHLAPQLGRHPSISIWFLVYLLLLHVILSQGVGFGIRLLAGSSSVSNGSG
jgi:hypothetical protein